MQFLDIASKNMNQAQIAKVPNARLATLRIPSREQPLVEPGFKGRSSVAWGRELSYNSDGDVLDLDWVRISRFVQRFAWQVIPPESIKRIRDYWDSREAISNRDGDRAEFDFGRTQLYKDLSIGYESTGKASAPEPKGECSTCSSRKYVDKSNDASVSYQTPTKLNPRTAALAVGAHEREHISNEKGKAERDGRTITSQTVSIKYSVCPECNIMYPSGGVARTRSVAQSSEDDQAAFSNDGEAANTTD